MAIRFWLWTAPRDRVRQAVARGLVGVSAGERELVRIPGRADGVVAYSPRASGRETTPLRAFTALGYLADDEPEQRVNQWVRRVGWESGRIETPLHPLARSLQLTRGADWGRVLRTPLIEIERSDFEIIRAQMAAEHPGPRTLRAAERPEHPVRFRPPGAD